jgi:peptidoglycan hydrolase-like protein with peptidoglycan-binding domain
MNMNKIILASVAALAVTAAVPTLAQNQSKAAPQGQSQAQPANQAANPSQDEIRQAQQALNGKGFKVGRVDGKMGPETRNALRDFQSQQKLQSTGQLDNATMAALGMSSGTNGPHSQPGSGSTVGQGNAAPKTTPSNNPPANNQKH